MANDEEEEGVMRPAVLQVDKTGWLLLLAVAVETPHASMIWIG
jgi:hypothetical protein